MDLCLAVLKCIARYCRPLCSVPDFFGRCVCVIKNAWLISIENPVQQEMHSLYNLFLNYANFL